MSMQRIGILDFWERVDSSRSSTLAQMSEGTGIPLGTLKNFRTRRLLPSLVDTVAIADYLGVSLDWLVLGKDVERGGSRVGSLLKAYLCADDVTKLMVERILGLS